jgi:SAM-dependent methyltransferase
MTVAARYDQIGTSYRRFRQPDPRIAAQVSAALGAAETILNVGAGAGSYEPADRQVIAVEPSEVMLAQRPQGAAPAVRAVAEALPFPDSSFDAALAILTVHHWADVPRGLAELRRIAARIVILTTSAEQINRLWLTAEYFPGSARVRRADIQPGRIAEMLGGEARIETVPVPHDCTDGFGEAYWGRPEAYLDPGIRAAMSACSMLTAAELEAGVSRLRDDLASGRWDERHGHLRELPELDTGHRLIIAA